MRNRWIYKMTGLPGWMRTGDSPECSRWSPRGCGPAAQYLATGEWPTPQMNKAWQEGSLPFSTVEGFPRRGFATPFDPWGAAELSLQEEKVFLEKQAEQLAKALADVQEKIKSLEKEKK